MTMHEEEAPVTTEELIFGPERTRLFRSPLYVVVALVAGLLVGHQTVGEPSTKLSTSTPHAAPVVALHRTARPVLPAARSPEPAGCPSFRTCRSRRIRSAWLSRKLSSDFPDVTRASIVATDDTLTPDRYQLRLVATLARGLTIEVVVDNAATASATVTPWIFVAYKRDARARYATRTIMSGPSNGAILRLTITAGKPAPNREARCVSCGRLVRRSASAAQLQGLSTVTRTELSNVLAAGMDAADNHHVLDRFNR